ncbi:MAG TPA: hypothetical protein VIJ51_16835 [Solirubrobacteraceae bacterium]
MSQPSIEEPVISNLAKRPGDRPTRRQREQRAYGLVLATSGLSVVAVVGLLLAVVGVVSFGGPVLIAIAAVVCGLVLRRSLAP